MKSPRTYSNLNIFTIIAILAFLLGSTVAPAHATASERVGTAIPPALGSNGQNPRPFYIVAHNPNQLSEATDAINHGANALEPDVMKFSDSTYVLGTETNKVYVNDSAGDSGLFMYHDDVTITTRLPDTVESYLQHVHNLVVGGANVALIVFDIKTPAANDLKGSISNASKLQTAVDNYLNYDDVSVNVIYSVGTSGDADNFFNYLCLGYREGVMIDADNSPANIYNSLAAQIDSANTNCGGGIPYNIGYGNGTFGESIGGGPNVLPSIAQASWIRAGQPFSFAIPYAYPIDGAARMNEYITAGVDGLIPDVDPLQPQVWSLTLDEIDELYGIVQSRTDIYLATAADDPFNPPNEAYALRIDTRHVCTDFGAFCVYLGGEGTDADLTFVLTGCYGSAEVTINAAYPGPFPFSTRFESGDRDYVTIHSPDLGALQSIQLKSDGTGTGPDWEPGLVQISSTRWGIPYADNRSVDFSGSVVTDSNWPTLAIPGWGNPCDFVAPVLTVPGNMIVEATSAAGRVVTYSATAIDAIDPNPVVACSPISGSAFPLGATTVNCSASDTRNNISYGSFIITVQDTTAPSLTLPADITVPQNNHSGATVPYIVTANDAVDASPTIVCTPPSGYNFPLGTTHVNCSATDDFSNTSNGSFNVTVFAWTISTFTSVGGYDGTFIETNETSGIGTAPNIPGGFLDAGDTLLSNRQTLNVMHFDTSTLPDGAVVLGLSIQVKQYQIVGTNPMTTHGNLNVDIVSPFFGTGMSLVASDFQAPASAANVGFFNTSPLPGNWFQAVLDSAAFPFLNLTGSTQFRAHFALDDDNDGRADLFRVYSGNSPLAANRPVLTVYYYIP